MEWASGRYHRDHDREIGTVISTQKVQSKVEKRLIGVKCEGDTMRRQTLFFRGIQSDSEKERSVRWASQYVCERNIARVKEGERTRVCERERERA